MTLSLHSLLPFLRNRSWTHYVAGVGIRSREDAIESMFKTYDQHHGRRRTSSREAFEVYRAKEDFMGGWVLYVREKRKTTEEGQ